MAAQLRRRPRLGPQGRPWSLRLAAHLPLHLDDDDRHLLSKSTAGKPAPFESTMAMEYPTRGVHVPLSSIGLRDH